MNLDNKTYQAYLKTVGPKSSVWKDCFMAFLFGGLICTIAQCFYTLYLFWGIVEDTVKIMVPVTLIFIAALLTGIGWFDKIAKVAGAGTLVPITGFANSVVAPAIDTKAEGFVMGLGAKIFTIAGPVITYGTIASVIYGIVYYFFLR